MNYAVIRTGGKQYRVSTGDILKVDKIDSEANKSVVFDDVLLVVNDGKATVGKPAVSGAKVEAKVLNQVKGDKIHVYKFKAKSLYRRKTGFRAQLSEIKIENIKFSGKEVSEKVEKPAKTTKTAPKETKK